MLPRFGQNLGTEPHLEAREAGECSLQVDVHMPSKKVRVLSWRGEMGIGFWVHPTVSVIIIRIKEAEEMLVYKNMNAENWRDRGVRA